MNHFCWKYKEYLNAKSKAEQNLMAHYKKTMLLFYEQNNISRFKEIFINQFEFAVNTYF